MFPKDRVHARRLLAKSFEAKDVIVLTEDMKAGKVSSKSEPGTFHVVFADGMCDCKAHENGIPCRHATRFAWEVQRRRHAEMLDKMGAIGAS